MQINYSSHRNQQRGLTFILVLVLLILTVSASLSFHQYLISSTRMSNATRDNSASLMLAESAMEMLRGGFINTLDSTNAMVTDSCSIKGAPYDRCRAHSVINSMDDPFGLETTLNSANLAYIFYVGTSGITQTSPSILQAMANGEATAANGTFCSVNSHAVSDAACRLRIDDLFSNGRKAKLYTTNDSGRLVSSAAATWNAERRGSLNNGTVAAAWMELTMNPDEAGAVDLWVESVAQVGAATSYVQRYVGTYSTAVVTDAFAGSSSGGGTSGFSHSSALAEQPLVQIPGSSHPSGGGDCYTECTSGSSTTSSGGKPPGANRWVEIRPQLRY